MFDKARYSEFESGSITDLSFEGGIYIIIWTGKGAGWSLVTTEKTDTCEAF